MLSSNTTFHDFYINVRQWKSRDKSFIDETRYFEIYMTPDQKKHLWTTTVLEKKKPNSKILFFFFFDFFFRVKLY